MFPAQRKKHNEPNAKNKPAVASVFPSTPLASFSVRVVIKMLFTTEDTEKGERPVHHPLC